MAALPSSEDIIGQVRAGDYERFLAIQLAPSAVRAPLYAVTAFHIELARIAEMVSEPLMGHIRLAWWREALEEIEAGKPPRNHPVVMALAPLYLSHPEIFPWLYQLIESRAADMDTSLIAQESEWRAYCDGTAGALHMAWALLLGGGEAQHEAVRAEAQAYAMIGLVRATPFMHQHGWLRFPHARMNAVGITALDPSTGLNALCQTLLHEAVNLLEPSRAPLPKPLRALAALAHGHAQGLLRVGGNPYAYSPQPLAMVWRVFKLRVAKIESFTNG